MTEPEENMLSLVVLEAGAAWPSWMGEYQKQGSEETSDVFVRRVSRRMQEVAAERAKIHVGLLVSNGGLEEAQLDARHQLCRAVLRTMRQTNHGELVLAADVGASVDVRHHLFELTGVLCEELEGSDVSVRVRFQSSRPKSGVMRSAPPVPPDSAIVS
jgi:hypothetical protein